MNHTLAGATTGFILGAVAITWILLHRLLRATSRIANATERIRTLTEQRARHDAGAIASGPFETGVFAWRCGTCKRRSTLNGVTRDDTITLATQHLEFCPGQYGIRNGSQRGQWDNTGRLLTVAWTTDMEWGVRLDALDPHTVQ